MMESKPRRYQGFAALHAAVFYNHTSVLEYLLKDCNADVDVCDLVRLCQPYLLASGYLRQQCI